jgi:hypothetical protein
MFPVKKKNSKRSYSYRLREQADILAADYSSELRCLRRDCSAHSGLDFFLFLDVCFFFSFVYRGQKEPAFFCVLNYITDIFSSAYT